MRQRVVIALVVATAFVHLAVGFARSQQWLPLGAGIVISIVTAWTAILVLAALLSRRIAGLQTDLRAQQDRHQASLNQLEQLAALNEMLLTLGRSTDVGLAF